MLTSALVSTGIIRLVCQVPRLLVLALPVFCLVFSVPWFFTGDSGVRFLGLPSWVAYALCAAAVYALVVAVLIGCCWNVSAGTEEDDE